MSNTDQIKAIKKHSTKLGWAIGPDHRGTEYYHAIGCTGFLIAPTHDLSSVAFAAMAALVNRHNIWLDIDNSLCSVWCNLPEVAGNPSIYPFDASDSYSLRDAILRAVISALEEL